jgi:hypothetical protein
MWEWDVRERWMNRFVMCGCLIAALSAGGCQSPTDPDDVTNYSEIVDVSSAPDPIVADSLTGGRTYRVVRGNNQPDEILPYDWHAVFSTTLAFNADANDNDVDVDFPVKISATSVVVKQASGGIVTPPSGSDTEKSEYVIQSVSTNLISAINAPVTTTFEIWYDLPSLRKEAVVTVAFTFVDDDNTTFQKTVDLRVAP